MMEPFLLLFCWVFYLLLILHSSSCHHDSVSLSSGWGEKAEAEAIKVGRKVQQVAVV